MVGLSDIEARAIRHATIKRTIKFLAKSARDPRRVGLRVFLLDYALGDPEARGKQKDLASRLNLSEARVSKAIEGLLASLDDLRK